LPTSDVRPLAQRGPIGKNQAGKPESALVAGR
jgi:hypothetical protein